MNWPRSWRWSVGAEVEDVPAGAIRAGQGNHGPAQVMTPPVTQAESLHVLHQPHPAKLHATPGKPHASRVSLKQ